MSQKTIGAGEAKAGELRSNPPIKKLLLNREEWSDARVKAAIEKGLGEGFNPKDYDLMGEGVGHWAARSRRPGLIRWLVEALGADVNAPNKWGETPLSVACQGAFGGERPDGEGMVRELLRLGADARAEDLSGRSALHWAAQAGAAAACEALVEAGASMAAQAGNSSTPWRWATRSCARGSEPDGPWSAERAERTRETLDRLLALGAQVDEAGGGRESALMFALMSAAPSMLVAYLLSRGADPNQRDAYGRTPLSLLCRAMDFAAGPSWEDREREDALSVVELLRAGADPWMEDGEGVAPARAESWREGSSKAAMGAVMAWAERATLEAGGPGRLAGGGRLRAL